MGTLHVVATPIGNLEDVTLRALRVLREADLLLAEDTRRTRVLLDRHGISARPRSLHAHNESARIDEVVAALAAGRSVALVSDAGTPLVSDPGGRLLSAALAAGHDVSPVPGPSAALAALLVSGLAPTPFAFLGFLPRRPGERRRALEGLRDERRTLVLFEAPHRLAATLADAAEILGPDRPAVACREMTKTYEEVRRGGLAELAEWAAEHARGEITLVVRGAERTTPQATPEALVAAVAAREDQGVPRKQAIQQVAQEYGVPKREVYNAVHRIPSD